MRGKSFMSSLWLAALVAAALPMLCPGQGSAGAAANDADPCDAKKQAKVKQKTEQFEQNLRDALGPSTLRNVNFDPCKKKADLGANIAGCNLEASDGKVNANCPQSTADRFAKAEQDAKDNGNPQVKGRATMFGGPADSSTNGWAGKTADGSSTRVPGVAVNADGNATDSYNRSHLGGYWLVHMDDGDWVYRQTDLGPAGWTGNKIDLTAGSLPAHGMSVTTPASWNNVSATYLGKDSSYAQYNGKCVGKCR